MAAAGSGGGGGKKSRFRWLSAARYAVASVVTALIVAVIVNAIALVLRPGSLSLSVARGTVFVMRIPPPPIAKVTLLIDLRVQNPSDSARMYYTNVTVYLFNNETSASTANPVDDSILYFYSGDTALSQQAQMDYFLEVNGTNDTTVASYFDSLYNGGRLSDATMRLDGKLITQGKTGFNTTLRPATYICGPLVVGDPDYQASKNRPDVNCTDGQAWLFL